MAWSDEFTQEQQPSLAQIAEYIHNPLWDALCAFIEAAYKVQPKIEYSKCSGARGWNVKYRKSGRALCTLYPNKGFFTCLVCIGTKESLEAELALSTCTAYLQQLYRQAQPVNGSRWLMIDVASEPVLEDVRRLLRIRIVPRG